MDAALHIVADDGLEALTMTRLALELDTAISAAYRYFPSKSHLVAEVQKVAIGRLTESLDRSIDPVVDAVGDRAEADPSLVRLFSMGRWLIAVKEILPEELRLLEMLMSLSTPALDMENGLEILPLAMSLLQRVSAVIDAAAVSGALRPGNSLDRTIIWAASLSGCSQTEKLMRYAPDLFASGRLTRLVNIDLLAGWGADPATLQRIEIALDKVAASTALAR